MLTQPTTLQAVLDAKTAAHPDRRLFDFVGGSGDGVSWSWVQTRSAATDFAAGLQAAGVVQGDHVAVMLPNGPDFIRSWFALGYLGAVMVAVNTEYIGAFLERVLAHSESSTLVVDQSLLPAVAAVLDRCPALKRVVVAGASEVRGFDAAPSIEVMTVDDCLVMQSELRVAAVQPGDTAAIMYTSGTTGAAKGVLMPEAHIMLCGQGAVEQIGVNSEDCYYTCLPLFHINALGMQTCAVLAAGARAVIRERFSASAWLADIRRYGCTVTNMLGALADFVVATAHSAQDRDHSLRLITVAPSVPELVDVFRERFGVADVCALYGMTEVNIPLYSKPGETLKRGSSGQLFSSAFDLAIVDPDTDEPRAVGEIGEIVVRPKRAFGFMQGYYRQPDKTVEAWRNLWFHTGDAAWQDADSDVFFVDRIKDCIRRRGENISSAMIESEITAIDGVRECAAVAVPAEDGGGEDEILLAYVLDDAIEAEALWEQAAKRLPAFANPRWWRALDALPKTPTNKVRKQALRDDGVTAETWRAPVR